MDFRILGPLEVLEQGTPVAVGSPRQRALLAVLVVHANEVVPASRLIDEVWEERPPASAANLLQGYVSNLRKALGKDAIVTRGAGYQLLARDEDVDARRFQELVDQASQRSPEDAAELLRGALTLWRGPALADLGDLEFARIEGARLDELRLGALEQRIEADLSLGRHLALVGELEALARRHTVRERFHRLLMLALYRSGRQSEALAAYRRARTALVELGIEPSAELRRLEQAMLVHDPSLEAPSQVAAPPRAPIPAAAPIPPDLTTELQREERKVVTATVIELVDLASPGRRLDPEEIAHLHDPYVARIRSEVESFGGVLDRFVAGVAVAYFGAVLAHEDDPERAVRASFAVQEAIQELNAEVVGGGLAVKIGVGTGEALVRRSGAGDDAVVVSDVVNLAMVLRAHAEVGCVVVAKATYQETERAIEYEPLGDVAADHGEPVAAWRAVARRWRYGFRPPREALTPLVGREEELRLLRTALVLTRRERSERLITIAGEPGIGKSRLVHELFELVEEPSELIYWRQGRSVPYGEGVAYWAFAEMVKAHASISETDSADEVTTKLSASVREVIPNEAQARRIEDHLASLVGAGDRAGKDRSEAFAAWRAFVEALAERGPTVLVFEDLHWADEGLLDFVEHLTEWATGIPLLLVCVAWPSLLERRPNWGRGARNSVLLALEPLGQGEQNELAERLCEATGLQTVAAATVARFAGGSPLFTEEYVRMLAEAGEDGGLEDGALSPPRSVQAVIAARLDGLPSEEKLLLQDAAVVGTNWWRSAVEAIGGCAPESTLRSLERKRLIQRGAYSSFVGEVEYSFSHALVRDVAYGELPRAQRAEKHQRCAELITTFAPGRDDLVEFAAYHYLEALSLARPAETDRSELEDRARITLREAGDRAAALFAYGNATRFYEAALAVWPPDTPGRGMLLHDLGHAQTLSASGDATATLSEAVDVLLREGDRTGASRAAAFRGASYGWTDFAEALRSTDEALRLLEGSAPDESTAYALADVASMLIISTEPGRGLEIGRRAVSLADRFGLRDVAARTRLQIGFGRCQLGDLDGRAEIEGVIESLEPSPRLVHALMQLAYIEAELGNLSTAAELHGRARVHAREFGHRHHSLLLEAKHAIELYWLGDWTAAASIADELLDESAPARSWLEPELHTLRGQIALARGDAGLALHEAQTATDLGRSRNDLPGLRVALAFAARAEATLNGDAAAAEELLHLWEDHRSTHLAGAWVLDLAWAVRALELGANFERLACGVPTDTVWLDAAKALVRHDASLAASILAEMGARPAAAEALVAAGRTLLEHGEREQGTELLVRAMPSLEEVGAEAYLQAARRLLTQTPVQ